jgi:hypothetical protein
MDIMKRLALAAALLAAAPASAGPHDDVLAVVNDALRAVNTNDAALLQRVMLPQAIITAQSYGPDGTVKTRVLTVADMVKGFAAPDRHVDEQIHAPVILVQRDLAHVWAPYTLDYNGKRMHCGVDSFGLARVDGVWKLTSLTWTAEPQGCPK